MFVMFRVWSLLEISSNRSKLFFLKETFNLGGISCGVNKGLSISEVLLVGFIGSA